MTREQRDNLTPEEKEKYYKWLLKTAKTAKKIESNTDRIYFVISQYCKKFRRKTGCAYEELYELLERSECRNIKSEMRGEDMRQGRYSVEFNAGLDNIYLK